MGGKERESERGKGRGHPNYVSKLHTRNSKEKGLGFVYPMVSGVELTTSTLTWNGNDL